MINRLTIFIVTIVYLLFIPFGVSAEQCSAIFPGGAQNNSSSGSISFGYHSRITNLPDNILHTRELIDASGGTSCDTVACIQGNVIADVIDYNDFPNNNNDIDLINGATATITPGAYNDIRLDTGAILTLSAGDYKIGGKLQLRNSSQIVLSGSGVVRIFVEEYIEINSSSLINNNGDALQLLVYGKTDILLGSNAIINGFIYSKKDVQLNYKSVLNGAVNGKNVTLISESTINFVPETPDFGLICSGPVQLLADYHFDECSYTGVAFEVIDETGDFPASTFGGLNTTDVGQVERAADLNVANHHIETSIPLPSTYSISTWFKKPTATNGNQYFILGSMGAGGDLLYIDRNNSWKWGVYSASPNGSTDGSYSFSALDNNWHHMTLVYSGGQTRLYIDGQWKDTINRMPSGTLTYIGTSFDAVSGSNAQSFRSVLDEFMVFDGALSAVEITDIYNNQNAKKNYDGSTRTSLICDGVVHYTMDEFSWSGNVEEVIDEMGNLNGQAFNGANTSSATSAIPGNPGTCGYGYFDGVNDYVQIADNPLLDLEKELTITVWINIDSIPSSGLKSIMSKDENYEFHVDSSGEIFWWWSTHSFSTTNVDIVPGTWYHIAVTYRSGQQIIYVNGVERASRNYTGNLILNNDPLQIGQDQGISSRFFNGAIDELKIYKRELSKTEINKIYNETRPCSVILDHFELDTLDEQGITCQADNIIIKACADSACSSLSTETFDVDLIVNGNVNRSITVNGGSVTTNYSHIIAGNAALSLNQSYKCANSATIPCNVVFKDSGFVFSNIPTQLSGKPSSIGFNGGTLSLQAIEKDTGTGACIGAFPDGGEIDVNLSYACDGGICSDLPLISTNGNSYNLTTSQTPHSLRFTTDSTAEFIVEYPHAAKFIIKAQKDVEVINDAGDVIFKDFSASSNAFVVRPFGFKLEFLEAKDPANANAIAANSSGSAFKKAGENFILTATAMQWVSGQDEVGAVDGGPNGVPDDFIVFNQNTLVAENFYDVTITMETPELLLPNPGNPGTLTQTMNLFGNSTVDNTYRYSEVGIIKLTANLTGGDYLTGGGNIQGEITNVGRFYPDHFVISDPKNGTLQATCPAGDVIPYAYSGQQTALNSNIGIISYNPLLELPSFELTAMNADNQVTLNYYGDFIKFTMASTVNKIHRVSPIEDANAEGKDKVTIPIKKLGLTAHLNNFSLANNDNVDGMFTLLFDADDNFIYSHEANAEVVGFNPVIDIKFNNIVDDDGAETLDFTPLISEDGVLTIQPIGTNVEIRFGRLSIENSYGPETSNLPQILSTQYLFSDATYITNTDDSCTPFAKESMELSFNTITPNGHDAELDAGLFNKGVTKSFFLNATNNQGKVNVGYLALPWLQYDWKNTGFIDPMATATFGIYRGNDRIIYTREVLE